MGFSIPSDGEFHKSSYKPIKDVNYNLKVAIWHLPFRKDYSNYDTDNSFWFEAINKNYENEIETVEKSLHMSLSRYKVCTKTTIYEDNSIEENSIYPNGNQINVKKDSNSVFVKIKNKQNQIIVEKLYNNESNEGIKYTYKHIKNGDDIFTIVRCYSYDTTKNKQSEFINYGYTSQEKHITKDCQMKKEYYLLNGKQVDAKKIGNNKYLVKTEQGETLEFSE